MNTTMRPALVLWLAAALLGTACNAHNDDTIVSPPEPQSATQGEAAGQPVSPEIERALEAEYQASLQRLQGETTGLTPHHHEHAVVDFEALYQNIRNTMPPARGVLLSQYVGAAQHVTDPATRTALLERLSSPELNNVR
jgi:hypothetical protein